MTFTVGRDSSNNIIINDISQSVSRYHAIIMLNESGSYSIIDKSTNGTYVNGIKLLSGKVTNINRGDIISFAKVAQLDWNKIQYKSISKKIKLTYNIGTDNSNQIILYDHSQKISRFHAELKIDKKNNIFISDKSKNGTFVNGIKINSNIDFPITKKDTVSFANVQTLNWSFVRNQKKSQSFKTLGFIVLTIFLLISIPLIKNKFSNVNIAEKYKSSVVLIYHEFIYKVTIPYQVPIFITKDINNQFVKYIESENTGIAITGTGFFVNKSGKIVTNRHVACPWDYNEDFELIKYIFKTGSKYAISEDEIIIAPLTISMGVALNNSIINKPDDLFVCDFYKKSNELKIDLACIQTKEKKLPNNNITIVEIENSICSSESIKQGMKLFMLGFPAGFSLGKTEKGLMANYQEGLLSQEPDSYSIGHNLPTIGGGSGSPIFDENGYLVAVNYAGLSNTQGFNKGILAKFIVELVK